MAAETVQIGHGTTVTFGTNGATFNSGFSATLRGLRLVSINRPSLDSTVMSTTVARTHIPHDLYDSGQIVCDVLWKSDFPYTSGGTNLITAAIETATITFGDAETWSGSIFCTDMDFDDPLDELMTGTITFKVTGALTN